MLKRHILGLVALVSIAQANEESWFVELGWQISDPSTLFSYDLFDMRGSQIVHFGSEGTTDMIYAEIGHGFELQGSDASLFVSAGTTFVALDGGSHENALFAKASVLYPTTLFGTEVSVGPKAKVLLPYNNYYDDKEFLEEDARRVEYDTNSAFAFGVEAVWGSGDWQMVTGLEYLTSAKYKGVYRDTNGYATSETDLDGVYLNIGLRYMF